LRRRPLRHASFRLFYFGSIGVALGYTMQATIAAWLMATLTPSAFMVALAQTASTAPTLLFGLVAAALADIADRRSLSRMGTHGPAVPRLCRIRMTFGARMSILQLGVLVKERALLHPFAAECAALRGDANWTLESPSAFAIGLPSADGSCAAGLISYTVLVTATGAACPTTVTPPTLPLARR